MKVLVFGAGALGSLMGARLARNHEVVLVARAGHAAAVARDGLEVRGVEPGRTRPRAVTSADALDGEAPPDLVVLTVKSYDTGEAARALAPWREGTPVVSLQNGLGNLETLAGAGFARVVGGVTYNGVTFVEPGVVEHAGGGDTLVGPWAGAGPGDARDVADALRDAGLPATVVDDVRPTLWTKAVVNACFNPLTALLRLPSGALAGEGPLKACCRAVVEECVAVAAAEGVALDAHALLARVEDVAARTATNRSSMLQDVERGRRTEIDAINGAIAQRGEAAGVACPVNRTLTWLVKAAEGRSAG